MPTQSTAQEALPARAWFILAVIYLAGLTAPLNQFKVPPMLLQLRQIFGIGLAEAGWLMSVFSLVGVILALPSGFVLQRFGIKTTGLLALVCLLLGSVLGGVAPDATVLLASRVIEGAGMCLIFIMAPSAIALWFPPKQRGAAMGVWGSWVPLGALLMLNIAPLLGAASWTWVWWAGAVYAAATLALFAASFQLPGSEAPAAAAATPKRSMLDGLKNRDAWLLGFIFFSQNMLFLSLSTFLPTYLETERGLGNSTASFLTSVIMICCVVSGALCGLVSGRFRSRRQLILAPMAVLSLSMFLPFRIDPPLLPWLMACIGLATGATPTAIFILLPETVRHKEDVGYGVATIALGQNIGMFLGPALFGWCVEQFGWITAGELFVPIGLLGFGAALLLRVR